MRAFSVITLTGCLLSACKPAAPTDKKEEAKQELKKLEDHHEKTVEKATQGTIPEPKASTFDPTATPKSGAVKAAPHHP